jgi:hypothetical protein
MKPNPYPNERHARSNRFGCKDGHLMRDENILRDESNPLRHFFFVGFAFNVFA